jgi:hypothetical protein
MILTLVTELPLPSNFIADSKLRVSNEGARALMRGRDAETRVIKTMRLIPGETTYSQVLEFFSYL